MGLFDFLIVVQGIVAASLVGIILMQRSEGGGLGTGGGKSFGIDVCTRRCRFHDTHDRSAGRHVCAGFSVALAFVGSAADWWNRR